jgi:DNA-binding transcriptional LysR family regulator
VPQALAAFQQHLPDVALDLTVLEPDEAIASLHAGTIDVAVVVESFAPGQAPSDGLRRRHLLADPFRMVIPRGHRLAARRVVDLEALSSEQWIGVNSCPGYCQQVVNEACLRAGSSLTMGWKPTNTQPHRALWRRGSAWRSSLFWRWARLPIRESWSGE